MRKGCYDYLKILIKSHFIKTLLIAVSFPTTSYSQTPPKKGFIHSSSKCFFFVFIIELCASLWRQELSKMRKRKVHSRLLLFNPFSLHIISFKIKLFFFFNALTTMNMSSSSLPLNSLNFALFV